MNTYCVGERRKTGNTNVTYVTSKNGRKMMRSKCANCGARKSSFVKSMKGSGFDIHKGLSKLVGNHRLPRQKYTGEMHLLTTSGNPYSYC